MAFPNTLDDFTPKVDNTNDVMAIDVNELQTAIEALEAKVGVDSSVVTTSHDYKIAQLESGKQDALGFTPENIANKVTSISGSSTDTQYPSAKLVYDQLATKLATSAFTDTAVTGKLLTGYSSGAGTIAATDTILQAIQKLNGNISAITIPVKATGAELDTGTDDAKFATAKALADSKYITYDGTETLTNKRINARIVSAASYTTDTGTSLNIANCDEFVITAQAGALKFNNPSGTPVEGQKLIIRIKDNGTACALTYDTQFRSIGNALPTTTVLSKTLYMGLIFNATDTKWDLVAVAQEA